MGADTPTLPIDGEASGALVGFMLHSRYRQRAVNGDGRKVKEGRPDAEHPFSA
jgi:hypothetical protein